MARRLKAIGLEKYSNGFILTLHSDCFDETLQCKKSHNIFVCSKSDLFHMDIPFDFIDKVMMTIKKNSTHGS